MKTLTQVAIGLCFAGALSYGHTRTFDAKLMDASCYDAQKAESARNLTKTCAPTTATTGFAFRTDTGKVYKVDGFANLEMASDIQNGTLAKNKSGRMHVALTGQREGGDMVKVDSIQIAKRYIKLRG